MIEAVLLRNLKPSVVSEDGEVKGRLILGQNFVHTWAYYQTFQVEDQNQGVEIPKEKQSQVYAQIIRWATQATVNGVEYEVRADLPKPEQAE